jgi:hypothetical protein
MLPQTPYLCNISNVAKNERHVGKPRLCGAVLASFLSDGKGATQNGSKNTKRAYQLGRKKIN